MNLLTLGIIRILKQTLVIDSNSEPKHFKTKAKYEKNTFRSGTPFAVILLHK